MAAVISSDTIKMVSADVGVISTLQFTLAGFYWTGATAAADMLLVDASGQVLYQAHNIGGADDNSTHVVRARGITLTTLGSGTLLLYLKRG